MQMVQRKPAAQLTVAEAAAILGRSTTWVRDRLTMGALEQHASSTPRRIMITAHSVLLAKRALPKPSQGQSAPLLRLIVDNSTTTK